MIKYSVSSKVIDDIYKVVKVYDKLSVDTMTCTFHGFQTENLMYLFYPKLLKKIMPLNNLSEKISNLHYIKYNKGGYQVGHSHENSEEKSFIVYLNDSDGCTVLGDPINKKIKPKKGKVIMFDSFIHHHAEKSYKGKEVLVGSIS